MGFWPSLMLSPFTSLVTNSHPEILYPKNFQDIQEAKDNYTTLRVTGGSYPFTPVRDDVVVDLRHVDRLIGLDIYQQTITVECGMKFSTLSRILETVSLSLDIEGRVPDLTVCDAIAVGAFGNHAESFLSSLCACEVALASGKIVTWTWERAPNEMRALCCGLGMTAVVLAVTFRCIPLQRYTEISYLCSIRDVLEQWGFQLRASFSQQLVWFPFSELTVMTHVNPTDKYQLTKQTVLSYLLERLGEVCSRGLRKLSLLAANSSWPLLASVLSRVQFFSLWSVAKHRSDFVHSLPRMWLSSEACRGSSWIVPVARVPEVLCAVSQWTLANPRTPAAPLFLQTLRKSSDKKAILCSSSSARSSRRGSLVSTPTASMVTPFASGGKHAGIHKKGADLERRKPFLSPLRLEEDACSVWYDWFMPECDPDPIAIAEFEQIFHSVGGVRVWSGERLTSPLVLADAYERYPQWCRMKGRLDPGNYLQSAYIQGTVWSESGAMSATEYGSTLSLCSSVIDPLSQI